MTRTRAEVVRELATAAELADFSPLATWRDALFEGDFLAPAHEPDRALLSALAHEHTQVDAHAATLGPRLHIAWLEGILGVPRLPVVPDSVVATATVDPALAPVVVPAGTVLRGGKDAFGNERRYATADALTAHGAALAGVRVYVHEGLPAATHGLAYAAPPFPIAPPQTVAFPTAPAAPHVLRITSPVLAFPSGDLRVRLTFGGATASSTMTAFRSAATWRHPRADGTVVATTGGSGSGMSVDFTMSGGCVDPAGGEPWVECVIPASAPLPDGFSFDSVTVAVIQRGGIVPDAAYANEGAVDITKEFEPFLATAAKGDAFYVRCDEAFGKPLASVTISVELFSAKSGGTPLPAPSAPDVDGMAIEALVYTGGTVMDYDVADYYTNGVNVSVIEGAFDDIVHVPSAPSTNASVWWQRLTEQGWQPVGSASTTFGGTSGPVNDVGSLPTTVSGQAGRYMRAFIASGDLGWAAYQKALADFAVRAATWGLGTPQMPSPIEPAIYRKLTIAYTTAAVAASRVESWSGWRHLVKAGNAFAPFARTVNADDATGMVALGLTLPHDVTGSSVTLYVVLDSAAPCGDTGDVEARWEWWDGVAWQRLLVADGTHLMRESGLVRFVAPAGWALGCDDVTEDAGRWIRFVTDEPRRIGVIRDVIPDAVLASYVSQAADPTADPSPATSLPPQTIKGTLAPIPGVKKMTNLASVRGRGPETDGSFADRASALARHRGRAITAWDYEQTVTLGFPEVAAVRCLPHTDADGDRAPGYVGMVLVPDQPLERQPRPSVSLGGRVRDLLTPMMPINGTVAILCPAYVPATVEATITLRRSVAALTGTAAVTAALELLLHPTGTAPTRWGVSLYASTLVAALERVPEVDAVTAFTMRNAAGTAVEVIDVDACRGLYCSSGAHLLTCEEQP